jgi:transposase
MKIEHIDIEATIEKARQLVSDDKQLSAASKSMFEILILVITLLANRLNLNSTNSSKPPSSDANRKKKQKSKTGNKPGGQKGHVGTTLKKVDDPDKIKVIKVDRSKLPAGQYRQVGFESRQVFDIDISRVVTEYRAQILEDAKGRQFVASFPEGVNKAAQYGTGLKAHSVYMSQFQLIPYNRIQDYFADQLSIPVSEGSIFNFNMEAYLTLKIKLRANWPLQIWHMPMKPASILAANGSGCTACPMITGHIFIPMKRGDSMLWLIWAFSLSSTAYYAMIIGNHTIKSIVPTHCAMPTT